MILDMNFKAVQVFVLVAESRSMSLVAEQLKTSPSTISQQIANLEKTLGATLLDRSKRPITLTTAGRWFLPQAQNILHTISTARSKMMEIQHNAVPSLKFAIMDGLDVILTPDFIYSLKEKYPDCEITALTGGSSEHFKSLSNRKVDLVITADMMDHYPEFEQHLLVSEPLIVVTAKNSLNNQIDLQEQLLRLPLIRYSSRLQIGKMIDAHLSRIRWIPNTKSQLDSSDSIFATLLKYGGWALTSPICLYNAPYYRTRLDVTKPPFPTAFRTISLWARKQELGSLPNDLSALCRYILIQSLVDEIKSLMPWIGSDFQVLNE